MYTTIIDTQHLQNNLSNPNFVIIDCRFELLKPEWGLADYQRSHIPGAVFADLNNDLSSPITPITGRHPLPDPITFNTTMSRLGVDETKQVVVVDTVAGAFAVRLWWLLRIYGHPAVAVLEGGFGRWEHEKRPVQSGIENNPPAVFHGAPDTLAYVSTEQMEAIYTDPSYRIIDARSEPRYLGETEPIDTVAGHIPGAVNRFHTLNLSHGGLFQSSQTLQQEFTSLLDGISPQRTIIYCGSGVTSCFHILAMEMAGLHDAKLYPGSWSEWIRDSGHPIATNTR